MQDSKKITNSEFLELLGLATLAHNHKQICDSCYDLVQKKYIGFEDHFLDVYYEDRDLEIELKKHLESCGYTIEKNAG